ncbi:MAG: hypothetical protein ABJN26_10760 [Stappiaceae bacterium]
MNKIISSSIAAAVLISGAVSVSAPASAAGSSIENSNVVLVGGKKRKFRKHRRWHKHRRHHWGHARHWGHGYGHGCYFKKYKEWSEYHGHHIWVKRKICGHNPYYY